MPASLESIPSRWTMIYYGFGFIGTSLLLLLVAILQYDNPPVPIFIYPIGIVIINLIFYAMLKMRRRYLLDPEKITVMDYNRNVKRVHYWGEFSHYYSLSGVMNAPHTKSDSSISLVGNVRSAGLSINGSDATNLREISRFIAAKVPSEEQAKNKKKADQ